jgi:hypothetical protein
MSKRTRKRLIWLAAISLLLTYVLSYVGITQRRYEQFRGWNACGFWYVSWADETSKSWETKEQIAATVYGPLNYLENRVLGLGMPHAACSPFFGLSK